MPMHATNDLFQSFARGYEARRDTEMTLSEYLEACRDEPLMYASAAERILAAIGEPEFVDTARDSRLGRIFMNRTIRTYPAFREFYGMEETIERIVSFFRHAAQGLEERKQILYLLGPVGGGKSSLAERLKLLMEVKRKVLLASRVPRTLNPLARSGTTTWTCSSWRQRRGGRQQTQWSRRPRSWPRVKEPESRCIRTARSSWRTCALAF